MPLTIKNLAVSNISKTVKCIASTESQIRLDPHQQPCINLLFPVPFDKRCNMAGSINECSDRGDCVNGACVCDQGYSGSLCNVKGRMSERYVNEDDLKERTGEDSGKWEPRC